MSNPPLTKLHNTHLSNSLLQKFLNLGNNYNNLYYARKKLPLLRGNWRENGNFFRAWYKCIQNSQISRGCIFRSLSHFPTKLRNFTNFKMLFRAVGIDLLLD